MNNYQEKNLTQGTPTRLQMLGGSLLIVGAVFMLLSQIFSEFLYFIFVGANQSGGSFLLHLFFLLFCSSLSLATLSGLAILHRYLPAKNQIVRILGLMLCGLYWLYMFFYFGAVTINAAATEEFLLRVIGIKTLTLLLYIPLAEHIGLILYTVSLLSVLPRLVLPTRLALWGRWVCWLLVGLSFLPLLQYMLGFFSTMVYTSEILFFRTMLTNVLPSFLYTFVDLLVQCVFIFIGILLLNLRVSSQQTQQQDLHQLQTEAPPVQSQRM
jgi:hypothetical protein